MKLRLSLIALALSLFAFGFSLQNTQNNLSIAYNDKLIPKVKEHLLATPVHISVPSVGIDQEIKPGGIVNGQWILSTTYIHYVSFNPKDNEIIYYAHERTNLFDTLHNSKVNDQITITNKDSSVTKYTITSIKRIKPTDIEALTSLTPNTIGLYTCDGAFDQYRLFVTAKLTK